MALINTADKIYAGAVPADKVYAGTNLVWQSGPAYPAILDTAPVWIDATQDSFADGATITSYTSHSTSGRVFTGSSAVTYLASVAGKPRLYFNGGWLKSASYTPPSTGFTFAMVCRWTGPSPSSGLGMPMVYNEDAFNNYEMRIVDAGGVLYMVYEYTALGGGGVLSALYNQTTNHDYLQWCEWNTVSGGPVRMYVNNALVASTTFGLSHITTATAALIIGTRGYAGDFPAIMQVGEAVVFDGVLSDANRNAVSDYLTAKWGL